MKKKSLILIAKCTLLVTLLLALGRIVLTIETPIKGSNGCQIASCGDGPPPNGGGQ